MLSERDQFMVVNLDDLVPKDHFLRKLDAFFPWDKWAAPFEKCFKGEKEYGPKGYPVSVLLKAMVLSFLYDLSDKQTEDFVRENNPGRYFIGLGLHQPVPDETTLCRFRSRIIERKQNKELERLFEQILQQAQKLGIEMGQVQILDSVHTNSKVNIEKENQQNRNLQKKGEPPKPPKDKGASWGCKGKKKHKDPESGKMKEENQWFYGYKTHVSENQKTGLCTSIIISSGNAPDNHFSRPLLEGDLAKGIRVTLVTGDKAYDDTDFYSYCNLWEVFPAIRVRKTRLEQSSKKLREFWENHIKLPFYNGGLKIRYKIEQKFGEAKSRHGFGKCRYFGLEKFSFQSFFTFMAMNLKRIIKLVPAVMQRRFCLAN